VTAYTLGFGSLLLLGGRLADLFGRKRTLITGLAGFAVASAVGGAAQSFTPLIAARAVQGIFAALLAPAALSLLTTTFTDSHERGKAFGVFGAVAGTGAGIGLLLGGFLTEYLCWRWCLYVNLVFAAVAGTGAVLLLSKHARSGTPRLDIPGTLTGSAGLFALVYGFSEADRNGWGASSTLGFLAAGVALLAAVGMVLFAQLGVHSTYAAHVLPGLIALGLGLGLVFARALNTATLGVDRGDAGVASATVNTAQQVGGSLGTALLNTVATTATTTFLAGKASPAAAATAAVHGYTTAFWWAAAIFAAGAAICGLLLQSGTPRLEPAVELAPA